MTCEKVMYSCKPEKCIVYYYYFANDNLSGNVEHV